MEYYIDQDFEGYTYGYTSTNNQTHNFSGDVIISNSKNLTVAKNILLNGDITASQFSPTMKRALEIYGKKIPIINIHDDQAVFKEGEGERIGNWTYEEFLDLGDDNFTLLTGKSGVGKTTIFDAISFVLYGKGQKVIMHGKKSCKVVFEYNIGFKFSL